MAYGYNNNNGNDTKTMSAHWVERKNNRGDISKYFSMTMEIGGSMYTFRIYANSSYTPSSGKNKDNVCIPVRVTRWQKGPRGGNKW